VGLLEKQGKAAWVSRDKHKMNVIGHETVSPDFTLGTRQGRFNEIQIGQVVICTKESFLPAVTPLRDVMRITGNDQSRDSGHGLRSKRYAPFSAGLSEVSSAHQP
jgi:hypothetical protein